MDFNFLCYLKVNVMQVLLVQEPIIRFKKRTYITLGPAKLIEILLVS